MASNKKKDAAALYELLDKSTLNVTRKAGAPLKIPSWWSARSNPAQAKTASNEKNTDASASAAGPPPDPNALGSPSSQRDANSGGITTMPRALELFLRYRPLVLVVAAVLVMIMIMLIVLHHSATTKPRVSAPAVIMPEGMTPKLEPVSPAVARMAPTPSSPASQPAAPAVAKVHQARVYPSSQAHRRNGYYYLVIVTTLPQYARSAAQFIAAHGVSVTIEPAGNRFDAVVSVRGFKHRASRAARDLQQRVIQIGNLMPGAARSHRSVFNTAFFAQVQTSH
jgi:hypothetical protein